jgi:2-dehydro-3-deoxygluconokinase
VAVKLGGSDGVYVCTAEEEHYVPSYHVDHIVDTVGAGDGFAAGFTSGLLDGLSLYDAARRGAAIGALQIQVAGDNEGLPTRSQLQEFQERAE